MGKHHYFIALAFSEEEKKKIAEKAGHLAIQHLFKKWVHTEDYHVTLAFLGAAERDGLDLLMDQIEQKLQREESFPLLLTHFETFGRNERPRIFFIAPEKEERLDAVQAIVAGCCRMAGFRLDEKPFNPHITIARNYIGETNFTEEQLSEYSHSLGEGLGIKAKKLCLYETHIDATPKYMVIRAIFLQGN